MAMKKDDHFDRSSCSIYRNYVHAELIFEICWAFPAYSEMCSIGLLGGIWEMCS